MRIRTVLAVTAGLALALPISPVSAGHQNDARTKNLHPMGHIEEPASLLTGAGGGNIHTDIAFWGKHAFQGSWLGFNIRDIAAPGNPKQVSFTSCTGNQGDVVVWEDILVRSWNSPASAGATCDGSPVPLGFEGLHVFDVSDVADPVLVASVNMNAAIGRCGSHTATGVPDLANNRLVIYNSGSQCDGFDVVEIPLGNPAAAARLSTVAAGRHCHDIGVILGGAMKAGCAGGNGFSLFDISGSLVSPVMIDSVVVPGVGIGHSAQFSNDGDTLVFGHEPGGGVAANCQVSNPAADKSYFFFDITSAPASLLGTWTLPRPQSNIENCTLHNLNIVPVAGRDILVHGSYQSGTSVVDFTNPAAAVEIAWSDPPPIPPPGGPFCGGLGCEIGGAWSSYWYNNFIYETHINEGLNVFRFSGKETAGALRLDHLNPQTQEFTLP